MSWSTPDAGGGSSSTLAAKGSDARPCLDGDAYCPYFQHAVEVVGRRWSASILRQLHFGVHRFGEIRAAIPGLSDRLLAARLRELVDEGVVERDVDGGYRLTEKGAGLAPVLAAFTEWASTYSDGSLAVAPGRIRGD